MESVSLHIPLIKIQYILTVAIYVFGLRTSKKAHLAILKRPKEP